MVGECMNAKIRPAAPLLVHYTKHKADHGHTGVWLVTYAPPKLLCC
jgi:hypothetical protein